MKSAYHHLKHLSQTAENDSAGKIKHLNQMTHVLISYGECLSVVPLRVFSM